MEIREKLLLLGPNRRCEPTVFEQQFVLAPAELEVLAARLPAMCAQLIKVPPFSSGSFTERIQPALAAHEQSLGAFAIVFSAMALALQQHTGHDVTRHGYALDSAGNGVWVWFEYEHPEVADRAADLALRWLAELEPALTLPVSDDARDLDQATQYREFLALARERVLPRDTAAIIAAAGRLDVPCQKLEREPFIAPERKFRVRKNGMLKLGHCAHQHIIDGTFSLSRNAQLAPLLRDRVALRRELSRLHVPLPKCDPAAGNCIMTRKAVRAAEQIGFPVVVKAGVRGCRAGVFPDLKTAEEVRAAVDSARHLSNNVSVEALVAGQSRKLLVVNHELLGAFACGEEIQTADVHSSITDLACRLSRELGVGMLLLDVVTPDFGRPLEETGGVVVDCDLAPQLDRLVPAGLIPAGWGTLDRAAEAFVRWMYPPGSVARIPVIAVTGTNGKTTTCHMIERIQRAAGRHPGVVCSDGIFVDEKYTASRQDIGAGAHHGILEVGNVDVAVLEEYFGRILRVGFAFEWCDVAVCTNVTNDHLGRIGIHTLEEMAAVKFEMVRRARGAVVLNADDSFCLAMAKQSKARRICLVSNAENPELTAKTLEDADSRCVVEPEAGRASIVIYDGAERIPLVAIDDIPATFAGAAAHNISNAMHAAAACYFSGMSVPTIAEALRAFRMSFDATPGRLNIFDGLPFRVIMDYAHNMDGFRRICAFVDRQSVAGRKIIMFSVPGDRRDSDIKHAAAEMAGHFDLYVCRVYSDLRRGSAEDVPALLKAGLCEAGVAASAVTTIPDAAAAIRFSLSLGAPGDLLVMLPGQIELASTWQQIKSFHYKDGQLGSG